MRFKVIIFACFLSIILSTPHIFGGDDHDKVANQLISLTSKLNKKNLEELRDYALNIESYTTNGQMILGGLHDYIKDYNKQALLKYIINSCLKNRELLEEKKFESGVHLNLK